MTKRSEPLERDYIEHLRKISEPPEMDRSEPLEKDKRAEKEARTDQKELKNLITRSEPLKRDQES